jgi:DNA-binding protein HU-beta
VEYFMNKSELIDAVSKDTGQPKTVVQAVLDAAFDNTVSALRRGDDVKVYGFGTYSVQRKAARTARNPRTGEPAQIAESNAVRFKAADAVTSSLNLRSSR